jgi:hypothetical protein
MNQSYLDVRKVSFWGWEISRNEGVFILRSRFFLSRFYFPFVDLLFVDEAATNSTSGYTQRIGRWNKDKEVTNRVAISP